MIQTITGDSRTRRKWTGREDNEGHYHGLVPLSESPLTLSLFWKASRAARAHHVGDYRLDLGALVAAGYARVSGGMVRLRFQSTGGSIQIAINRTTAALAVGKNPVSP